jgi:hypothetical protein
VTNGVALSMVGNTVRVISVRRALFAAQSATWARPSGRTPRNAGRRTVVTRAAYFVVGVHKDGANLGTRTVRARRHPGSTGQKVRVPGRTVRQGQAPGSEAL